MPTDEIATAIARCAGCHPDSVATVGSIDSGEREPSITGAILYGAAARSSSTVEHQLRCRSRRSSPSIWRQIMRTAFLQELPCQDALRVAVVPCTSVIRAMLVFTVSHHPAHNLLVKCMCCRFAQVIEVTSDPRITFPYLLKIRASTLGLCALPAGFRSATITRLKAPSTSSRDVPSLTISAGVSIKPS